MQLPLEDLSQVTKGELIHLLSDAEALYASSRRLACLSRQDCDALAGEQVRVLATDDGDDTVKVKTKLKGEIWFPIESFASDAAPQEPVEQKEEVPLHSLSQITAGRTLKLLRDAAALRAACRRVACLSQQDCERLAGTLVQIVALDPSDGTVSVNTEWKGEIWFTVQCFVEPPAGAVFREQGTHQETGAVLQPEPVEDEADAAHAAPAAESEHDEAGAAPGIFQQFTEMGNFLDAVGAAAEEAAAEARHLAEEEAMIEDEEMAAARAAREAAAEERRKQQQSKGSAGAGAAMLAAAAAGVPEPEGPCATLPLGRAVRVLQNIVMRSAEEISSPEIAKLTKGQELRVLEHGTSKGGRRLLAKDMDTNVKGWVSCATKQDKPLLDLLPGIAIPRHELDPPMSSAIVKMPTVEEVLARVDADIYCDVEAPRVDDGSRAPKAILDGAEEEAEAICVWRAFDDMAAVDEPEQEDPREADTRCIEARAREQKMFEGDLDPMVGMIQEQAYSWQDRQLKQLAKDRKAKVERTQKMKDKLKEALNPRSKGLMPKVRGICTRGAAVGGSQASSSSSGGVAGPIVQPVSAGAPSRVTHFSAAVGPQGARLAPRPSSWPEAPSSQFAPGQQACLQSVEDLRCTLAEERAQAHADEQEPSDGGQALPPAQPAWVPRRARTARSQDPSTTATAAREGSSQKPAAVADEPEVVDEVGGWEPELAKGMAVQIHSLKSTSDLNGLHGVVERWESDGNRWVVRLLDGGRLKKFRAQNLTPCGDAPVEEEQPGAGTDEFGPAWFGQPGREDADDAGADAAPSLDELLKRIDGSEAAVDAGGNTQQRGASEKCEDYGKPEYWARLGLAPLR